MRQSVLAAFTGVLILILPLLTWAQDTCNLLPVSVQTVPLFHLADHTVNKTNVTLCEKYTPPGTSQYDWMVQLINLAFTGEYKPLPNQWPADPNGTYQGSGILDPHAVYRDPCNVVTPINLVPFFNGTYRSNNRNGKVSRPNPLSLARVSSCKQYRCSQG